ncbi:hypothetical protein NQD34_004094 [Periophthalmus magnuspinnatus]|nr:hypothetical protein NQD34_004094 [Periophthalmus magnuspinnatus]
MKRDDPDYVNDPATERHTVVHCGKRVKVTVLRVAMVLAVVLIIAYVFDGVALLLSAGGKNKVPEAAPTSPMAKLQCDEGWQLNGEECYYFVTTKASWDMSLILCQAIGGALVKIDTIEKQEFLFAKMRESYTGEIWFWIGLTDSETEGEWKWTDGSSLNQSLAFWYVFRTAHEPDNWTTSHYPLGEDCAQLGMRAGASEHLSWFDRPCSFMTGFICEKQPRRSTACQ